MAADESKGRALERRVGRLEFAEGALVRLRAPVIVQGDRRSEVITDIDVMALEFDGRLSPRVSIFECKSSRGQRGESDRLLWVSGLQRLAGADRAVLARDSASGRGRTIARRLGLEIFDSALITQREKEHGWVPSHFATIDGPEWIDAEEQAARSIKRIGDFPGRLYDFLRYESLTAPTHRVLGSLVTLSEVEARASVLPPPARALVAGYGFVAFVVAALRSAGRLDALGSAQVRSLLETGVLTGNPFDAQVLEVATIADALLRTQIERVHQEYARQGTARVDVEIDSIRDEIARPQPWMDQYMDLVERLRARASVARQLHQTAELACFDAAVKGAAWRAPAFDYLFTVETRQLLLVALEAYRAIAGPISDELEPLRTLPFDRQPPLAPDRAQAFEPTREQAQPSHNSGGQSGLFSAE